MEDPFRRPGLGSALFYKDAFAALDWLEKAFGFERTMVITDKEGNLGHSEMRFGDGYIMIGGPNGSTMSPARPRSAARTPSRSMSISPRASTPIASGRGRPAR